MMIGLLVLTAIPTWLVSQVETYDAALLLALGLGLAGTSFAVGIAWVSAWYPADHQGFALGVFGAGNVGASITKLLAPTLVTAVGHGRPARRADPRRLAVRARRLRDRARDRRAASLPFVTPRHDRKPSKGRVDRRR